MKKIIQFITIVILSAVIGAGIFSFVIAKKLYFPNIKQIAYDGGAGLTLTAYQYSSWLWNREKIIIINIEDMKNDAPNFQYKLKGEVYSLRVIHSGEDYALIAYSNPDFSSIESGYVVHRSPKSESENTIEEIHIDGNIIAVAPDESGYFYISGSKIFKRSWQGDTLMEADLGIKLEPILDIQLTSMVERTKSQSVSFFSNNTKMAFLGMPVGGPWYDGYLFIWNFENNEINKISRQDIGGYNDLGVENDNLYVERADSIISKKLIVE